MQKIARAATDEGARALLPRIVIAEDVTPDRVSIETGRMSGIMIGARFEIQYHVKAPKGAVINARTTNGGIVLSGLTGKIVARTTNGGVRATGLSGPVDAESTNGGVVAKNISGSRKNSVRSPAHSCARTPSMTSGRWLRRRSRTTSHREPAAPAFSSRAP